MSSSSSSVSPELSLSQAAFEQTLHPLLREACAVCHFSGSPIPNPKTGKAVPGHADASVTLAHEAVLPFVNLDSPQLSIIAERMSNDRHNCGEQVQCDAKAKAFRDAIARWADMVNDGNVVASCDPSFPQDLILLAELPYLSSIQSLLGAWVLDGHETPDPATKLFSQKGTIANVSLVNSRLDWAVRASDNFQRRAVQLSGCFQANKTCARNYIEKVARTAFKRPLQAGEVNDLMTVYDQGATTSFAYGIKLAVQAILLSPSFNHRTEYGQMNADGNFDLTPHEIASTLSYLLTDSLPDSELAAAADSGALADPAERERQALRLLSKETTKSNMEYTLLSAWNFGNLFGKVKDPTMFPQYSANLASQMYEETRLFLRHHLWSGGISEVLTGRTTFVNGALADLYGIPFPGSERNKFMEVYLADDYRAGILTQASFLTAFSRTDETSVVARGLFVNGPLLCLPDVPAPPLDVISEIEEQLTSGATEIELADYRGKTAPCMNCHNQFDAYGLMFEQYDAIGKHRLINKDGSAIESAVSLGKMATFSGISVEGPVEFGELLGNRPEFIECVTRHMFAYGTGNDGIHSKQCEVTNITKNLNKNSSLTDILRGVVTSPALSTRVAEAAQ